MDPEFLKKPRKWDASDLSRFMIYIGPISSIFDIATYLVMWYVFSCNSPEHQTLFQTGWFVEGLLSQTLIVHMIRTRKIPFIQSRATWPVMGLTFLIMAVGILIPFTADWHFAFLLYPDAIGKELVYQEVCTLAIAFGLFIPQNMYI